MPDRRRAARVSHRHRGRSGRQGWPCPSSRPTPWIRRPDPDTLRFIQAGGALDVDAAFDHTAFVARGLAAQPRHDAARASTAWFAKAGTKSAAETLRLLNASVSSNRPDPHRGGRLARCDLRCAPSLRPCWHLGPRRAALGRRSRQILRDALRSRRRDTDRRRQVRSRRCRALGRVLLRRLARNREPA